MDTLEQIKTLASDRLEELRSETAKLEALLEIGPPARKKRASHKMSAAARKAVSLRMKKFWAERKRATK